ncbi:hypothetical protein ACFW16_01255 [Inquilinus sp. NPDC058860]|uniref:hypothetical protein n=1 Tax=Inquilinus sp. NPDC058860 TaxID=3346652 RepID=UPI0036974C46
MILADVERDLACPGSGHAGGRADAAAAHRRQRQAVLLGRAVQDLGPSLAVPGFQSRLAWRLDSQAAGGPGPDHAGRSDRAGPLADQACRAACRLFIRYGLSGPAAGRAALARFDASLERLIPGVGGGEIRRVALGGWPSGPSVNPPAASSAQRPAGVRLLAALAVIAVTLGLAPATRGGTVSERLL